MNIPPDEKIPDIEIKPKVKKVSLPLAEFELWNKTEKAFGDELELWKRGGEITWWAFEPIKLRLAKSCFYTPDFAVMQADRSFEFFEVKGFWRDDARVKIKVAVKLFPMFRFTAVSMKAKRDGGGWKYEVF